MSRSARQPETGNRPATTPRKHWTSAGTCGSLWVRLLLLYRVRQCEAVARFKLAAFFYARTRPVSL